MEYSEVRKKLINIIRNWKDIDEKNVQIEHHQLSEFISNLKELNWRRIDVFDLTHDLLKTEEFSEAQLNIIWDFESSITGHVHQSYILEFPDENFSSEKELVDYVRGGTWKDQVRPFQNGRN